MHMGEAPAYRGGGGCHQKNANTYCTALFLPNAFMEYQFRGSSNLILKNLLRTYHLEGIFDTIQDNVYFDTVLLPKLLITT